MIDFINDDIYSESGLSYNVVTGKPTPYTYGYKETTLGIFAEDTWKVNRKLTVNYGVRYDNNGNPYVDAALPGSAFPGAPKNVISNLTLGTGSNFSAADCGGVFKVQPNVFPSDRNWIFAPARRVCVRSVRKREVGDPGRNWTLPRSPNAWGTRRTSWVTMRLGPRFQPSLATDPLRLRSSALERRITIRLALPIRRSLEPRLMLQVALLARTSRWARYNRTWPPRIHGLGRRAVGAPTHTEMTASFGYAGTHSSRPVDRWRQHGRYQL